MIFLDKDKRQGGFRSAKYDPIHDPGLLGCPFCSGPSDTLEVVNTHSASYWIECPCGAEHHGGTGYEGHSRHAHRKAMLSAIAAWNNRESL